MMRAVGLLVLVGCGGGSYSPAGEIDCGPADPIPLAQQSQLAFSGDDLLAAGGSRTGTLVFPGLDPVPTTVTFSPIDDRALVEIGDRCNPFGFTDDLTIPVTATATLGDEEWDAAPQNLELAAEDLSDGGIGVHWGIWGVWGGSGGGALRDALQELQPGAVLSISSVAVLGSLAENRAQVTYWFDSGDLQYLDGTWTGDAAPTGTTIP
jgi:hypothetical protein